MLNDIQENIYTSSKDFIICKLISLIEPLKQGDALLNQSSELSNFELGRHVFLFVLLTVIEKDLPTAVKVVEKMYPSAPKVREVFLDINKLVNNTLPGNDFLIKFCDKRFISEVGELLTSRQAALADEFSRLLKKDIKDWYQKEVSEKALDIQYMNLLTARCYADSAEPSIVSTLKK